MATRPDEARASELSVSTSALSFAERPRIIFPPIRFPENGIIRVYNQFPRRYSGGLPEMIADLPRIAEMGFNAVWINPIQLPSSVSKKEVSDEKKKSGSMYAMADDDLFNPDFFPNIFDHVQQVKLVQQYSATARALRLTPMFDLVLNHVGKKTALEEKFDACLKKPHELTQKEKGWSDARPFRYADQNVKERVIAQLWEPYILKYMRDYGFAGIRVDAITNVDFDLQRRVFQIVNQHCLEHNHTQAIILGELMVKDPSEYINKLQGLGFTHIFAAGSLYRNFRDYANNVDYTRNNCWLIEQAEQLQQIIWPASQAAQTLTGGTAGIIGNHDVGTLKAIVLLNLRGLDGKRLHKELNDYYPTSDQACPTLMAEKILRLSALCNGGWYLLSGDEYGVLHKPQVFDYYREPKSPRQKWGGLDDITVQINGVNTILQLLPKAQLGDKTLHKRILVDAQPLEIVVRHCAADHKKYALCLSHENLDPAHILAALQQDKSIGEDCLVYVINKDKLLHCDLFGKLQQFKELPLVQPDLLQQTQACCHISQACLIAKQLPRAYQELLKAGTLINTVMPSTPLAEKMRLHHLLAESFYLTAQQATVADQNAIAASAHYNAGLNYMMAGNLSVAQRAFLASYQIAMRTAPTDNALLQSIPVSLGRVALIAKNSGDLALAADTHCHAASIFLSQGNMPLAHQALVALSATVREFQSINFVPFLDAMAQRLNSMNCSFHAFECYSQIFQLQPNNPRVQLNLGLQAFQICMSNVQQLQAPPLQANFNINLASTHCFQAGDRLLAAKDPLAAENAFVHLLRLYERFPPPVGALIELHKRFNTLGQIYDNANETHKARECYSSSSLVHKMIAARSQPASPTPIASQETLPEQHSKRNP